MRKDEFEPRLGRMRAEGSKRGRRYLHQVLAGLARAGGPRRATRRGFDGSRIGRGAAIGRLLRSRGQLASSRGRRCMVKVRLVRVGSGAQTAARAHLRYIQRDGVERDGSPGSLYSGSSDHADGRAFLDRCDGDRHQFRFIVSAEDGHQYEDLKPLTRRLMAQVERDLGTRLDWVAVDHLDTAHPHTHIMLRGVDERGQNLVIAREYVERGLRERAAELVTLDLGPRTNLEIEQGLRAEIGAERLTSIDRRLLREQDADGAVRGGHRDPFQHSLRAGRLKKLEALGFAEHLGGDRWRLAENVEDGLRRLSERGDVIRTLQRALTVARLERGPADRALHQDSLAEPITGRVIARGLLDEIADRHYLIVDGIDGRAHLVGIGRGSATEPLPQGSIVRISPHAAAVREVDRLVAEIAAANGGRYSVDLHLRHDPRADEAFARAHIRRLEAIRRGIGGIERREDGDWMVGADHLARARAYEERQSREQPVEVALLSPLPLEHLAASDGATWLDRELLADAPAPLRQGGFGREVRDALAVRRAWLLQEALAFEQDGGITYRRGLLAVLQRRELLRVADQISAELGIRFSEAGEGASVGGRLSASGRRQIYLPLISALTIPNR